MNQILKLRIRHLEAKSTTTVIQNYYVTFILQVLHSEQFRGETFAVRRNLMEAPML